MALPADLLFSEQWHLRNTVAGQYDLDICRVWNDYTGKGVDVFVIDNGFDYSNQDLARNYDTARDYDYGNNDDDAAPFYSKDNHGTAVAGIISAARNGSGVVGVAYDSSLIGFRVDFAVDADAWRTQFVSALHDTVTGGADVVNMSFGGISSFDSYDGAANVALMKAAIDHAVTDGRDGLGIVLVKAAGNWRVGAVDVNHSSMDSDTRQIIVAAVNKDGYVADYSSYGAPNLVSAFGSVGDIVTTDRTGADGYNTASNDPGIGFGFAGTSAAAPMVSGIVALMLEANADLGWRDVQSILAYSARHVGSKIDGSTMAGNERNPWDWNGASNWNGGGLHYSMDYGYGLVDAVAAVRLAETWQTRSTSANESKVVLDLTDETTTIPDGDLNGSLFVSDTVSKSLNIERVTVDLTLQVASTSDLEVYLIGPDGREYRLIADQSSFSNFEGTISLNSQALRGEKTDGTWSVRVVDDKAGNALSVSDIVVTAYGATASKNNTYFYTNEFSDYVGTSHSAHLIDTNRGRDTLNASAVTTAMNIDLGKGYGTIDGVSVKIAGIENVFGGDGNDRLRGNGAANVMSGGRGTDIFTGCGGDDTFVFHSLSDSRRGGDRDVITDFGRGDNRIDLSDIDALAIAGDQAFTFVGENGFTGDAGELSFRICDKAGSAHDRTLVNIDLNGDGRADFQIELAGLHSLVKGDFIL